MVRVYSTLNAFAAHVIRSGLAQHGIEAEVRNEMLAPLAGALPLTDTMPEVWVAEADAQTARQLINELQQTAENEGQLSFPEDDPQGRLSDPSGGELSEIRAERTCPNCGEVNPAGFGECWNCQTELP